MKIKKEEEIHDVNALIKKAVNCHEAGQAMHFTQAALNAANALVALSNVPNLHGNSW